MTTPASNPAATAIGDLVDLERYPIHELDGAAGRQLVASCRSDLDARGACQLEGFIQAAAIERLAAEADDLKGVSFRNEAIHNVYFEDVPAGIAPDDPRGMMERASQATVAYDLIPADATIRAFYESDELLAFVGAALGKAPFYRNADPLGALNLVYYAEGDELGWHFDRAEFVVTLMLQPAVTGGDFDYVPNLRSDADENYAAVARLLQGDPAGVHHAPSGAGTLAFFRGRHSIHRVTPIRGDVLRTNAVLSFADRPDHRLNELTQRMFYGRTA